MNEESNLTTFMNSRGSSNIDLTVVNNHLLRAMEHWEVSDQGSCSDHSIIKFVIGQGTGSRNKQESQGVRYNVKNEDIIKFQGNLIRLLADRFNTSNTDGDITVSKKTNEVSDKENFTEDFQDVLKLACDKSFRQLRTAKKIITRKSVPWGTDELTVMRKTTNAIRRSYQRTRNHEELREKRKTIYLAEKAWKEATIKREKIQSRNYIAILRHPPTHGMKCIN